MRKLILVLIAASTGMHAFAQGEDNPPLKSTKPRSAIVRPSHCPKIYITTSTGINNNTGVVGFNFEMPVDKNISVDAGAGISTWGSKVTASGKYYLNPCQRGWAFGLGFTYNTGIDGYESKMETIYGKELVKMNLQSCTNIFFAAYRYWNLGKRYNRFFLEFGWSVPLSGGNRYEMVYGDPLSDASRQAMNILSPGGPIVACGFSFGIYSR